MCGENLCEESGKKKVWRKQRAELLSGPRSLPLSAHKTLVETLDLMQVHFFDLKLFMLALLLFDFFFLKGKGYTSSEDIMCL